MDFESISLTARTQCLATCLEIASAYMRCKLRTGEFVPPLQKSNRTITNKPPPNPALLQSQQDLPMCHCCKLFLRLPMHVSVALSGWASCCLLKCLCLYRSLCLCAVCVLCSVFCVLCSVLCVCVSVSLCFCVLCLCFCVSVFCVLCFVLCALCSVLCVLCSVLCALCFVLCALCSVLSVLCTHSMCAGYITYCFSSHICVVCLLFCFFVVIFLCMLCAVWWWLWNKAQGKKDGFGSNRSKEHKQTSATRTRTRVARVRAEYPNQLDYSGVVHGIQMSWQVTPWAMLRNPRGRHINNAALPGIHKHNTNNQGQCMLAMRRGVQVGSTLASLVTEM